MVHECKTSDGLKSQAKPVIAGAPGQDGSANTYVIEVALES
jgi:hypothetical protein